MPAAAQILKPNGARPLSTRPEPPRIEQVSVISPMRNESAHIDAFISDVAAQDFAGAVEVLIADGGSTDDSRARVRDAAARHGVTVTLLDNPERWVSSGLNACIRRARGDLIVRLDCHSRYPADYLRRCVQASEETGAEVVGGVFVPAGRGRTERAVACAMESPFGGIHWMRAAKEPVRRESDIAVYGAFRLDAFRLAGLFDESLVRNQDDEFTLRLRQAGGRVVLDPAIRVHYVPRGTFRGVFRQYFEYGRWKIPIMRRYRRVSSARSLAPVAFVTSLAGGVAAVAWSRAARRALAVECGVYVACAVGFGTRAVRARREAWPLLTRVMAIFPTFHVAYGAGMLVGVVDGLRHPDRPPAIPVGLPPQA